VRVAAELKTFIHQQPYGGPVWSPPQSDALRGEEQKARSLPRLCDREREELSLFDLLDQRVGGRPAIIVLHGDELEVPETFHQRVAQVSVGKYLDSAVDPRTRPKLVPWPDTRDAAAFRRALERAVKGSQILGYAPEDAIVVGTDLLVDESFGDEMQRLIDTYVDVWCNLDVGRRCLLIVCLAIRYRTPTWGNWFAVRSANAAVRRAVAALKTTAVSRGCSVLDPLGSVPLAQARHWTELPQLRVAAIDADDIDDLYAGKSHMTMKVLMPRLEQLIKLNAHARTKDDLQGKGRAVS
jgi:hypothetical protein